MPELKSRCWIVAIQQRSCAEDANQFGKRGDYQHYASSQNEPIDQTASERLSVTQVIAGHSQFARLKTVWNTGHWGPRSAGGDVAGASRCLQGARSRISSARAGTSRRDVSACVEQREITCSLRIYGVGASATAPGRAACSEGVIIITTDIIRGHVRSPKCQRYRRRKRQNQNPSARSRFERLTIC